MRCTEVLDNCQPYVDGHLDDAQRAEIQKHLDACPPCAERFKCHTQFDTGLKTAVSSSARMVMPADLRARLLAKLEEASNNPTPITDVPKPIPLRPATSSQRSPIPPEVAALAATLAAAPAPEKTTPPTPPAPVAERVVPLPPRSGNSFRRSLALAASVMLALAGYVGYQAICQTGECRMISWAQLEHDNIVAGKRTPLLASADMGALTQVAMQHVASARVPDLEQMHLRPSSCGSCVMSDKKEGVYICYNPCQKSCPTSTPATLLIVDTSDNPRAENYKDFLAAKYKDHQILSWRCSSGKGPLYMLVTKMPLDQAVRLAEMARKDIIAKN